MTVDTSHTWEWNVFLMISYIDFQSLKQRAHSHWQFDAWMFDQDVYRSNALPMILQVLKKNMMSAMSANETSFAVLFFWADVPFQLFGAWFIRFFEFNVDFVTVLYSQSSTGWDVRANSPWDRVILSVWYRLGRTCQFTLSCCNIWLLLCYAF